MDRHLWLSQIKERAVQRYNRIFAPNYDRHWGQIGLTHEKFVREVTARLKPGDTILDAACGTGKYWPQLLEKKLEVIGVDRSTVMLDNLRKKFPGAMISCSTLQNISLKEQVPAIICTDAMENVPPEDWPKVLRCLWNNLSPDGLLYFTVELEEQVKIDTAYATARAAGLPVVPGEVALDGYHYYPQRSQVLDWLEPEFMLLEEEEGNGYWHLLCRRRAELNSC